MALRPPPALAFKLLKEVTMNVLNSQIKSKIKALKYFSLVGHLLMGTACSKVNFSPAGPLPDTGIQNEDPNGQSAFEFNDSFVISEQEGKLDLLVVVDNSASMADEQIKLGMRIESLLGHFSHVNWQMGITTTDLSGGVHSTNGALLIMEDLQPSTQILTKNHPDYLNVFLKTLVQPESLCETTGDTCASGTEEPMRATVQAMQLKDSINSGFFRDDADTAVIILSDEDEMSTGPVSATQPQEVVDTFEAIWGKSSKKFSVSAIIVEPGDSTCSPNGFTGDLIAGLVSLTNGVMGSICDDDYGQNLKEIAYRVESILQSIKLSEVPEQSEMQVVFEPEEDAVDYEISERYVHFRERPKPGTRVTFRYNRKGKNKDQSPQ
jgi:hypothetical protein